MREVLDLLLTDRAGIYVDATVGGGGHARAILEALGDRGRLIGLDRDPAALEIAGRELEPFQKRAALVGARASELKSVLTDRGIEKVDGVLLDLGISSDQLASARGFSFDRPGVLDLRFDPTEPGSRPARAVLATIDEPALAGVLARFGEFSRADSRRFARQLLAARDRHGLDRMADLRAALDPVIPPHRRARTLARVVQSLRILVNRELDEVAGGLEAAAENLRPGGILCVISYQSLEDRLVKRFLAPPPPPRRDLPPPAGWREGRFDVLTRRPLRPTPQEIADNPRARSARLRAGRRRV